MTTKFKYYSLNKIETKKATYNMIFGERSNGKTYAVLQYVLKQWFKDRSQFAYVRRWKEDVIGRRASNVFSALVEDGSIEKMSDGDYTGVYYYAGRFYLCNYDDNGKAVYGDSDLLGFTFSLSDNEHNKSNSYPNVKTIMFDEFLTKGTYLPDEFVLFMNTISTIIRLRTDVQIFMLGNTVNKYCPYFKEMGITHVQKMEQGDIDVYSYGKSKLKVAVEYCASNTSSKKNNFYFAFNNPKLSMITGGAWELDIYPHLPVKYNQKDVEFTFFIVFNDQYFQCEVVNNDPDFFIYIHAKTTELKNPDSDLIYTLDYSSKLNYNRNIWKPQSKLQENILWYFRTDRIFYQDNEVGDAINNYLKICKVG